MDAVEFRPLSLRELLARCFRYYRSHFWIFFGIMASSWAFLVVLSLLMWGVQWLAALGDWVDVRLIIACVKLAAYLFTFAVAYGAMTFAVSQVQLGNSITIRGAYRRLRGRVWQLILLTLAIGLRVFGLLLLFLASLGILAIAIADRNQIAEALDALGLMFGLPVGVLLIIVLLIRYAVAIPALMLENIGDREAIKRSILLTKGFRGRLFLIGLLMALIGFVLELVFVKPFSLATGMLAARGSRLTSWLVLPATVSAGVSGALSGSLLAVALVLAYFDARVRREGFALRQLMASLD